MIKEIRAAGREDWRATAWLLERMFKELSLKQQHEISGPQGEPIRYSVTEEQKSKLAHVQQVLIREAALEVGRDGNGNSQATD